MQSTHPKKITLLRLSAIGDVLMLLPAVRLLKTHYPNTQIDWIIDRPIASLLSELTEVTIIPIDKPRTISDYWRLKKQWQGKNTGQLISFQTSLRSNMLTALLPADHKTGFGRPYTREGHQFVINTAYPLPEKLHQVELFYALAQKFIGLDIPAAIPEDDLSLPLSDADINWAKQQLSTHQHWIAINPMASSLDRTWDIEKYIDLTKKLSQLYPNKHILLTGGRSNREIDFNQQIQQKSQIPCLNLTGKTELKQLAALFQQVDYLIAPDTGPAHLANAMSTSVIGLFAAKRPEYTAPYNQIQNCINMYEQAAQSILHKPISQLSWQKNIPGKEAINLISVDQVIHKIKDLNL